jgi:hypothetical protein
MRSLLARTLPFVVALVTAGVNAAHAQRSVADSSAAVPEAGAAARPRDRAAARARPLSAGDTVRIVSAAGRYEGTISRLTPDTIVLLAPGRLDAIPRGEVAQLERFRGKSPRGRAIAIGAGAGLAGGSLLGGIAGRVVGRIRCTPDDQPCTPGEHDRTIQGALLAEGAFLGALFGAMLGPTFRREHWERAEGAFPLVEAAPGAGGIAAGVTLRF